MSPNYYTEQMCETKMDPESPESEDHKTEIRMTTMTNRKSPSSQTNLSTASTMSIKEEEDFPHHHHHHHSDQPLTPQSQLEEEEEMDDGDISTDDMISVGGSPSPSPSIAMLPLNRRNHRTRNSIMEENVDEYFRPFKKLRMVKVEPPSSQNTAGLKSFSISDILSHKPLKSPSSTNSNHNSNRTLDVNTVHGLVVSQQRIVRPWDPQQHHHHHHHQIQHSKPNGRRNSSDSSPLDALFQMTSKTFEGLNGHHDNSEIGGQGNAHQAFNSRQPPKKKRKSRTAFTNHQIFELEKRFLYQKYLSPADRDAIAQQLGLTNAQVITWFQNRRAKLKRDMEELKKDMETTKMHFLESAHDLGILRKRAHMEQQNPTAIAVAASFHISSPTSSSQSSHSPINLTSESPPSAH